MLWINLFKKADFIPYYGYVFVADYRRSDIEDITDNTETTLHAD
jgi:hypothetical protein